MHDVCHRPMVAVFLEEPFDFFFCELYCMESEATFPPFKKKKVSGANGLL